MKSKKWFIAISALGALGFLYSFDLGKQSLWIDEGYSINAAQAVLERGVPILDSGAWYPKGILQTYVMAGSMTLFGFDPQNPWSARLPSVLLGILSVCSVYILSKKAFNFELMAFLSAVFLGLFTWQIAWFRQARGFAGMELFIILSFFFLYKWFDDKKGRSLFCTFGALGVSILFHPPSAVFVIPVSGFVLYEVWKSKLPIFYPVFFSVVSISVLTVFMLKIISLDFVFKFTPSYFIFLKDNLLVPSILAVLGIILGFFDREHRKSVIVLSVLILFPIFLFSIYRYSVHGRYLLVIVPILLMLATYATVRLVTVLTPNKFIVFTPVLATLILLGLNYQYLTFYQHSFYPLEQWSPQPDFKDAYRVIKEQKGLNDIVISSYTHLSQIFLGDKGFWLPISPTRTPGEIERYTFNNTDYYTGAEKIHSIEELKEILKEGSGFIVMDRLSKTRLGKKTWEAINLFNLKEIYHSGEVANEIWVYRFN